MSDLPKTVGSWGDVVAWLNHHTELLNGLNERVRSYRSDYTWRLESLTRRVDLLVFRWVEGDILGDLLEQGDPDDGFSLPWSLFLPYVHQEARAWGLYVLDSHRLAEDLLRVENGERVEGAIFTERRGGGFRALTDATPEEAKA